MLTKWTAFQHYRRLLSLPMRKVYSVVCIYSFGNNRFSLWIITKLEQWEQRGGPVDHMTASIDTKDAHWECTIHHNRRGPSLTIETHKSAKNRHKNWFLSTHHGQKVPSLELIQWLCKIRCLTSDPTLSSSSFLIQTLYCTAYIQHWT